MTSEYSPKETKNKKIRCYFTQNVGDFFFCRALKNERILVEIVVVVWCFFKMQVDS